MSLTTSVVICAYTPERWDQLWAAVASVQAQRRPVDEVVVVIDHHDALLARAVATFEAVTVLPNAYGRGLSGARNTGIEASCGDVVCFLDDDAAAESDWSEHLLAPYADPRVLGVGGAAVPVWESAVPAWWPEEFGWVVGCSYRGQPTALTPVRNLMGCNMSLRRSVLEAAGGFDAGLGRTGADQLGCEETELCIRAGRLFPDGAFLHQPAALVRHHVPRTRASWRYFVDRCRAEGLSKARVARSVGRTAALASETTYVRRVLPHGVLANLGCTLHGELSGVARAGAIVAGLTLTASSFAAARWTPGRRTAARSSARSSPGPTEPVLPLVVDLDQPIPAVDARRPDQQSYRTALVLLTRSGVPVGRAVLDLDREVLPPELVGERLGQGVISSGPLRSSAGGGPSATPHADATPCASPTRRAAPTSCADVTVVIATRERPERLDECLRSVLAGSVLPQRVVVVDNAPTSCRTAELVAGLAATEPRLRYVREDRPGLARAHNAALPHVLTPLVAFTDDDVRVEEHWLARLVAGFADDTVACVTGLIAARELDTLAQQWVEGNTVYDKGLDRRVFDNAEHRPPDPLFPYTSGTLGSGANMAFRTDYLRHRHGFDPSLGTGTVALGGDDLAAFFDVIMAGRRVVYEPGAIVLHQHHRDYAALRRQTYGYGAGLGAHLTRCLVADPRMAVRLARHAATTLRRADAIVRPPVVNGLVSGLPPYPADLSRQQLRGLASGPWRYLRSRRRARREVA